MQSQHDGGCVTRWRHPDSSHPRDCRTSQIRLGLIYLDRRQVARLYRETLRQRQGQPGSPEKRRQSGVLALPGVTYARHLDCRIGVRDRPEGSTAKRPKVLDANAGRRTLFRRRGEGRRLPGALVVRVEVRAPAPVARLVDRPGVGLSVIPSPRGAAWSAATTWWARSIKGGDRARRAGGHDCRDPHPPPPGSAHADTGVRGVWPARARTW